MKTEVTVEGSQGLTLRGTRRPWMGPSGVCDLHHPQATAAGLLLIFLLFHFVSFPECHRVGIT